MAMYTMSGGYKPDSFKLKMAEANEVDNFIAEEKNRFQFHY